MNLSERGSIFGDCLAESGLEAHVLVGGADHCPSGLNAREDGDGGNGGHGADVAHGGERAAPVNNRRFHPKLI